MKSMQTILRRSFPTWLFLTVPLAAAAPAPWQTHAPLPEPRTEVAAGVARGELVAVGGFTANGGNSARADAYSIARNAWRRLPDLPLSVDHAAAASANGNVYVVGGYGGDRNPLDAVFVLGPDERWRRLPELPDARAAAAAAIAGGKLYVLGGVDGRRGLARVAFALDLKTRRWARLPARRRASTRRRGRDARLRARRPQRGDRHEHEPVRGLRRAGAAVDAAGTHSAGPRRHRSGLCEREDLLDRRRAPAGHDRVGLHVCAADEALAAPPRPPDSAPRARGRRRRGPCLGRRRRPAAGAHGQRRSRVDPAWP